MQQSASEHEFIFLLDIYKKNILCRLPSRQKQITAARLGFQLGRKTDREKNAAHVFYISNNRSNCSYKYRLHSLRVMGV